MNESRRELLAEGEGGAVVGCIWIERRSSGVPIGGGDSGSERSGEGGLLILLAFPGLLLVPKLRLSLLLCSLPVLTFRGDDNALADVVASKGGMGSRA